MSKRSKKLKGIAKSKKHTDLKPWLALFKMFRTYVTLGYLQIDVSKHEAYVTQPAIHALIEGDDAKEQIENGSVIATAGHVRDYAAWLSGEGKAYLRTNFAVHAVKPEEPHDLVCSFVFTRKLRCFKWKDKIEVITYPKR